MIREVLTKLFQIFPKSEKRQFIGLFFLLFIGSLFELIGVSVILPLIQALLTPDALMENKYTQKFMKALGLNSSNELLVAIILGVILLYVIKNAYLLLMTYAQYQIIWHNEIKMELRLFDVFIHKPYSFHTATNTSEIQRTILSDTGNVFSALENTFLLISDIITVIFLAILLFVTNSVITLAAVVLLGLYIVLYLKIFRNRLYQYGQIGQEYGGMSVQVIQQAFQGIKEVKVYHSEEFLLKDYRHIRGRQISMIKRSKFVSNTPKYFLETFCIAGIMLPLLYEIYAGHDLTTLVSQIAVFAAAAYKLIPQINRINAELSGIINSKASVDLVHQMINVSEGTGSNPVWLAEEKSGSAENAERGNNSGSIRVSNLSFHFDDDPKLILKEVNLEIPAGRSVAFVGASGSGKTTLADLILSIRTPVSGSISYSGTDLRYLGSEWYKHIGYIPQSIYLSDDTIRNNILFGRHDFNDEAIWTALEKAQLADFVRKSEKGLDTKVGEGGARISGGQRQRIGIARALLNDPEILVLDEATSALDNDTEKAVMEAIDQFKGQKTLIIIAHRLSTIENCDEVYEVKNGNLCLKGK
ncbi:MAG: ABC transporter ATP-binding protein [Lachnospiraceae bacterium]|nr:ABC transporter ATP-binding protein [Lachnospiraceae bacterium]